MALQAMIAPPCTGHQLQMARLNAVMQSRTEQAVSSLDKRAAEHMVHVVHGYINRSFCSRSGIFGRESGVAEQCRSVHRSTCRSWLLSPAH
jgi:hypothetical protein